MKINCYSVLLNLIFTQKATVNEPDMQKNSEYKSVFTVCCFWVSVTCFALFQIRIYHSFVLSSSGSYAMRDLVSNLPSGQQRPAKNLEEDTVVAILNTIHEIITDSSENARSLITAQAIDKLVAINRTRQEVNGAQTKTMTQYGFIKVITFKLYSHCKLNSDFCSSYFMKLEIKIKKKLTFLSLFHFLDLIYMVHTFLNMFLHLSVL